MSDQIREELLEIERNQDYDALELQHIYFLIHDLRNEMRRSFFSLNNKEITMAHTIDEIKAKVEAEKTVEDSLITLTTAIKAKLDAAGVDQATIDSVFGELDSNTTDLANAITANTPASGA